LKRLARFLESSRQTVLRLQRSSELQADNTIRVWCDASWASTACCKSTSGYLIEVQGVQMMTASKTQSIITRSSAEAELLAVNGAVAEALFLQTLLSEMDEQESPVQAFCDSSACIAALSRHGLGRLRHLQVRHLWMQQVLAQRRVELAFVAGSENPADALTKQLASLPQFQWAQQRLGLVQQQSTSPSSMTAALVAALPECVDLVCMLPCLGTDQQHATSPFVLRSPTGTWPSPHCTACNELQQVAVSENGQVQWICSFCGNSMTWNDYRDATRQLQQPGPRASTQPELCVPTATTPSAAVPTVVTTPTDGPTTTTSSSNFAADTVRRPIPMTPEAPLSPAAVTTNINVHLTPDQYAEVVQQQQHGEPDDLTEGRYGHSTTTGASSSGPRARAAAALFGSSSSSSSTRQLPLPPRHDAPTARQLDFVAVLAARRNTTPQRLLQHATT